MINVKGVVRIAGGALLLRGFGSSSCSGRLQFGGPGRLLDEGGTCQPG